jgi:glucose/arabinose dehydrogenase
MRIILLVLFFVIIAGGGFFWFRSNKVETPGRFELERDSQEMQAKPVGDFSEVAAEGLDTPWGMVFLPDGGMLVTERPGRVRFIDKAGVLQNESVAVAGLGREFGEGGLMGIELHPEFEKNNFVYLYYSYAENGIGTLNRVVRMRYVNGKLDEEKVMVDNIPGAIFHDGGRIKFGPDGYLYITTGDAQQPDLAQEINSLAGKVLRVTDEGGAVSDNPFGNLVYSFGHRNSQGLAWNERGELWSTEHGRSGAASGLDEINLIEAGKNYGWPVIQGDETRAGMVTPVRHSGANDTWAPGGAVFAGDSLFFTGLKGEALYEAVIEGGWVIDLKEHFKGKYGRLRDVSLGPDGLLYLLTSNKDGRGNPAYNDDRIIRVNPTNF